MESGCTISDAVSSPGDGARQEDTPTRRLDGWNAYFLINSMWLPCPSIDTTTNGSGAGGGEWWPEEGQGQGQ